MKSFSRNDPIAFGESGAKQSQDNKPLTHERFVRTASVAQHSLWSHPSLHSRSGMKVSGTRPLLARLSSAPSIPARPFGLGWRFDRTPSGSAKLAKSTFAPEDLNQAAKARTRYHKNMWAQSGKCLKKSTVVARALVATRGPFCALAVFARDFTSPGAPPSRTGAFAHLAPPGSLKTSANP